MRNLALILSLLAACDAAKAKPDDAAAKVAAVPEVKTAAKPEVKAADAKPAAAAETKPNAVATSVVTAGPGPSPVASPSDGRGAAPSECGGVTPASSHFEFDSVDVEIHKIASSLSEANRHELRDSISTPFRLVAGNAVNFCGKAPEAGPVVTKAEKPSDVDTIVDCIIAATDVAKMLRRHERDWTLKLQSQADLTASDIAPEFRQDSDYIYGSIFAQDKSSELVECMVSFRRKGDDLAWSGLVCGFDISE